MNWFDAVSLWLALAALAALPSASVALVVARASTLGFAHGAAVAAGIVAGDLLFVLLTLLGLSALAHVFDPLFQAMRLAAGAYLIWLAFGLFKSAGAVQSGSSSDLAASVPETASASRLWSSFAAGWLLTMADAKAIVFYASFFPVFVDVQALTAGDALLVFAITLLGVGGVKLIYAWLAASWRVPILSPVRARFLRQIAALLLVVMGLWLIFSGN